MIAIVDVVMNIIMTMFLGINEAYSSFSYLLALLNFSFSIIVLVVPFVLVRHFTRLTESEAEDYRNGIIK